MTLIDPNQNFKVTPLFNAGYLKTLRATDMITMKYQYLRPSQECHFEWPWVSQINTRLRAVSATAELLVRSHNRRCNVSPSRAKKPLLDHGIYKIRACYPASSRVSNDCE